MKAASVGGATFEGLVSNLSEIGSLLSIHISLA